MDNQTLKCWVVNGLERLAGPLSFGDRWYWAMSTLCNWSYTLDKRWGTGQWRSEFGKEEDG